MTLPYCPTCDINHGPPLHYDQSVASRLRAERARARARPALLPPHARPVVVPLARMTSPMPEPPTETSETEPEEG